MATELEHKENPHPMVRTSYCATMDEHRRLASLSPEYRFRRQQIELETRDFTGRYAAEGLQTGVVRIPVVVHVVWNTEDQNISDAQIKSQIAVLNADFRHTNADASNAPAVFAAIAADTRIEFALAVRDPKSAATNGITRTFTNTAGFTIPTAIDTKSTATGGADPWPSDRYLNMWTVNFTDKLLGWGTFPGGPAAIDGVVVASSAFGTIGTVTAPHNLGRVATHEVGHWLNLLHIWGDDQEAPNICSGSDECADTPNQGIMHFGAPTFPHISCGNGPNGDMFMDYMDYSDDAAKCMFTQDQATRMNAALFGPRASILASDGLIPATAASKPDLWMQDNADDNGSEPDPSPNPMYISNDIWVRNGPDGLVNQDHQNPLGEQVNYIYVRVRNRGSKAAGSQSGVLKLYWAKASGNLPWPASWNGSITTPALMGSPVGSQPVTVAGGAQAILVFKWTPPDPSNYASFGAERTHFCLLARIETSQTPPFGMTSPETTDLTANVRKNNKIVWKNVSVVDTDGDGGLFADVVVGNIGREHRTTFIVFETPRRGGPASLFDWGYLIVEFRGRLEEWLKGDLKGHGFDRLSDGRLIITRSGAELQDLPLKPGEFGTLHIRFVPDGRRVIGTEIFELDLTELDANRTLLGGQRFLLKTSAVRKRPRWDGLLGTFDGVVWTPKGHCGCGC